MKKTLNKTLDKNLSELKKLSLIIALVLIYAAGCSNKSHRDDERIMNLDRCLRNSGNGMTI